MESGRSHVSYKSNLRSLLLASVATVAALTAGCASIVHSGPRSVPVASNPPGATVSIYDRDGNVVSKQTTPFVASLRTKYRYFSGQSYRMVFEMPGYSKSEVELRSTMSGWYWGNILFGGLVGMLIVDPNTGAMYNLAPNKVEQTLTPNAASDLRDGKTFVVIMKSQATPNELAAMVPVSPAG
jgi:hypothetical protein